MEILQELNVEQKQAVTHTKGPILVDAGPGTGKTKVVTHRIAHLIRIHGVAPDQILAITFTRKAMEEMLDRTRDLLGTKLGLDVGIHTFHAFCTDLLREHASEIGLSKNFAVFEAETQDEILIECRRDLKLRPKDFSSWHLREIVEKHKRKIVDGLVSNVEMQEIHTHENKATATRSIDQEEAAIIKTYQDKLNAHQALDFDDLICKTVELLDRIPSVRDKIHCAICYLLVDEYQDVNAAQYALLRLLCSESPGNLMVVADKNQAIYGWRGSSPEFITKFQDDYNPTIVKLKDHYRSSRKIFNAAQAVISNNIDTSVGLLRLHQDAGHPIVHCTFNDPNQEAEYIVRLVRNLLDKGGHMPGDIAILYRNHRHADKVTYQLHQQGVRFQRAGGENALQKTRANDIVSYLRFMQEQRAEDLGGALKFPTEVIDDLTLAELKRIARRDELTLVDTLRQIQDYPYAAGPLTRRNVRRFFEDIDTFAIDIEGATISKIMSKLFELLERRRSVFRDQEIQTIEMANDTPNLQRAAGALGERVKNGKPVRIISSNGIDAICAAHIIHQTFKLYFDCDVQIEILPLDENVSGMVETEIHVFIGEFGVLPLPVGAAILIGNTTQYAPDVIGLESNCESTENLNSAKSIIALKLCQQLLSYFEKPNYSNSIIYDLETAGRDSKDAEIVEIAAMRLDTTGQAVETYHQLVKPPCAIPKSSFDVHGISDETVKSEPPIKSVLPEFLDFIQDGILVGHNVIDFDNPILERNITQCLDTNLMNACYDTMLNAQRVYPRGSDSLEALAEKFGVVHGRLHRAMEDVQVNRAVFEKLSDISFREREMRSLQELLPLVGIGILANARKEGETDVSEFQLDDEQVRGQTQAFLQAASRYTRTHNPNLEWLLATLKSPETDDLRELFQALRRKKPTYSTEDEDWNTRRTDFMKVIKRFQQALPKAPISAFLKYQESITSAEDLEVDTKKITLMTMHSAKGTEFPLVIMTNIQDDSLRKGHLTHPTKIEEERQLFYVGMTRAKERLYLSSVVHGDKDRKSGSAMFIDDIPTDLIQEWSPGASRQ